jgi:hypothetical protein
MASILFRGKISVSRFEVVSATTNGNTCSSFDDRGNSVLTPISALPTIIDGSGCGGSRCQDFPALCAGPLVFHGLHGQHTQEFEFACGNRFAKRLTSMFRLMTQNKLQFDVTAKVIAGAEIEM